MRALFTGVVRQPGSPDSPETDGISFKTRDGKSSFEASDDVRFRAERIQAGLQSLFNLSHEVRVDYKALIREGRHQGTAVPEAGALVIDASWGEGEDGEAHRIWIDHESRIDEDLTKKLGAEANFLRTHGEYLAEEVNEITEGARRAAIEETRQFRAREIARVAMIAA